jgi:hypothetical protein
VGFSDDEIKALVDATGPRSGREYGFTFSDLVQRLLPALVLDSYPGKPLDARRAAEIAEQMAPTPPFKDRSA